MESNKDQLNDRILETELRKGLWRRIQEMEESAAVIDAVDIFSKYRNLTIEKISKAVDDLLKKYEDK